MICYRKRVRITVTGNVQRYFTSYWIVLPMGISVRDRVRSHRRGLRAHGLKRIELIVPAERADELRRFAARLRGEEQQHQLSMLREMLREAFRKYRASCLDNISVDFEHAGPAEARVVANALMKGGNSDAFLLGRRIAKLAKRL